MSKLFRVVGIIIIILGIFLFVIVTDSNILIALLSGFFTVLLGLAFIVIGDLLDRVDFLEKKLKISNDEKLPQIICPSCGIQHDFDFPKCPKCKHEY